MTDFILEPYGVPTKIGEVRFKAGPNLPGSPRFEIGRITWLPPQSETVGPADPRSAELASALAAHNIPDVWGR